jgi:sialate O-acetylesterase
MKKIVCHFILSAVFIFIINESFSQVRLPAIIGNHMVLQQKSEVNIWGWSSPGENIIIKPDWDTATYHAMATAGALWSVKIKTPAAGGPYKINISGNNKIVLEDVLIGEVWLCGGQSNMEANGMPGGLMIKQTVDEAPNATNTQIRFFYVPKSTSNYPQDDVRAMWVVCSPDEMKYFSSVGYFFGKQIQQTLNIPIGLINSNWGGTPAETWTPTEVINNDTTLKNAAQKLTPSQWWPTNSGDAYNGMIYPITKFSIAGAIWYQGESNTGTNATYSYLLNTMIGSWRKIWQKDFPFYYVQIAPFSYGDKNIRSLLSEQQTKSLGYPNTGMVVISDLVDDVKNIHPQNKKDVGIRLANLALAKTYSKPAGPYKYPMYKNYIVEKNKIKIYIDNAEGGLITKNGNPQDFYIAGDDKHFVKATATIKDNIITVYNKDIKNPVAVRFGFTDTSMPNVFSKEGLPLNLFRTDNWDVETVSVVK